MLVLIFEFVTNIIFHLFLELIKRRIHSLNILKFLLINKAEYDINFYDEQFEKDKIDLATLLTYTRNTNEIIISIINTC